MFIFIQHFSIPIFLRYFQWLLGVLFCYMKKTDRVFRYIASTHSHCSDLRTQFELEQQKIQNLIKSGQNESNDSVSNSPQLVGDDLARLFLFDRLPWVSLAFTANFLVSFNRAVIFFKILSNAV